MTRIRFVRSEAASLPLSPVRPGSRECSTVATLALAATLSKGASAMARSLDGLVLAPVADQAPGQVGTRTRFTYHEEDGEIWAEYAGGDVVRGHLVGTREGDRLDFRYVQLKTDGTHLLGALCVRRWSSSPTGGCGWRRPGSGSRRRAAGRAWWSRLRLRGTTACRSPPD